MRRAELVLRVAGPGHAAAGLGGAELVDAPLEEVGLASGSCGSRRGS